MFDPQRPAGACHLGVLAPDRLRAFPMISELGASAASVHLEVEARRGAVRRWRAAR